MDEERRSYRQKEARSGHSQAQGTVLGIGSVHPWSRGLPQKRKRESIRAAARRNPADFLSFFRQTVGNGLVSFQYPSSGNEGEWETLGYSTCREEFLLQADALEKELKGQGVEIGSGGGKSRKEGGKVKRTKSRRQNSDD